jgi:hypothetical protein
MKSVNLVFLTPDGSKKTITTAYAKDGLTLANAQTVADVIIAKNIFLTECTELYEAYYEEVVTTDIV